MVDKRNMVDNSQRCIKCGQCDADGFIEMPDESVVCAYCNMIQNGDDDQTPPGIPFGGNYYHSWKDLVGKKGLVDYKCWHKRISRGMPHFLALTTPEYCKNITDEYLTKFLYYTNRYTYKEIQHILGVGYDKDINLRQIEKLLK